MSSPFPMRRAVAFCQVIEAQKNPRSHKVSSKHIAGMFQAVVEAYQEQEGAVGNAAILAAGGLEARAPGLRCEAAHVDGGMNASQKKEKLDWLKAATPEHTCRILSNVRCLSEGVDVIIHSVNDILQSEFGLTLGSKNVHILDPFTGICLIDTFQLHEKEDLVSDMMQVNWQH